MQRRSHSRRVNTKKTKPHKRRNNTGPTVTHRNTDINRIIRPPRYTAPVNQLVRMSWVQSGVFAGGSSFNQIFWATNDIIAPYGSGSQPVVLGRDGPSRSNIYYRVLSYSYKIVFQNRSTGSARLSVVHSNTNVSALSADQMMETASTGDGQLKMVGPLSSGNPSRTVFTGRRSNAQIVGKESYFVDDQYAGVFGGSGSSTSPTDMTYLFFTVVEIVTSPPITVLGDWSAEFELAVETYDRSTITA